MRRQTRCGGKWQSLIGEWGLGVSSRTGRVPRGLAAAAAAARAPRRGLPVAACPTNNSRRLRPPRGSARLSAGAQQRRNGRRRRCERLRAGEPTRGMRDLRVHRRRTAGLQQLANAKCAPLQALVFEYPILQFTGFTGIRLVVCCPLAGAGRRVPAGRGECQGMQAASHLPPGSPPRHSLLNADAAASLDCFTTSCPL